MTELSSVSQDILNAFKEASDGHYRDGEWIQDYPGQIAAALRTAADKCTEGSSHWNLYKIAEELENIK